MLGRTEGATDAAACGKCENSTLNFLGEVSAKECAKNTEVNLDDSAKVNLEHMPSPWTTSIVIALTSSP